MKVEDIKAGDRLLIVDHHGEWKVQVTDVDNLYIDGDYRPFSNKIVGGAWYKAAITHVETLHAHVEL